MSILSERQTWQATTTLLLLIPRLRTRTEGNTDEHWRVRQSRAKQQRTLVATLLRERFGLSLHMVDPARRLTVLLTRIAPRMLDEGDNLPSSLKHCRDSVADWLGITDRDPRVTWTYAQRRGAVREYSIEVTIQPYFSRD